MELLTKIHEGVTYIEEWKPIYDYDGRYEISSFGRIRSLDRIESHHLSNKGQIRKGKLLKIRLNHGGYPIVILNKIINEKYIKKSVIIHRQVAISFLGKDESYKKVNHINCIKTDNFFKNLEFCTQKENVIHAWKNGLCSTSKGVNHFRSKLSDENIIEIRFLYKSKKYFQKDLAEKFNVSQTTISSIVLEKTWNHIK